MEILSGINWLDYGALGFASIVVVSTALLVRQMLRSNERIVKEALEDKEKCTKEHVEN